MSTHSKIPSGLGARRDRTYQENEHDTYKLQGKLKEPTLCLACGAVLHKGRWTWDAKPTDAHEILCPACHRIRDVVYPGPRDDQRVIQRYPARGADRFVKNTEEKEKTEHPLSRIIGNELRPESLVISTTDTHLPRRIGEALKHAYQGGLELHYDQGEQFVQVTRTR